MGVTLVCKLCKFLLQILLDTTRILLTGIVIAELITSEPILSAAEPKRHGK